ncbi:MAG: WGR domain-containing protein, partial [Candidatus Thorarchaeota archaeon]
MSKDRFSTYRLELKEDSTGKHDFWIGESHGKSVTIHFGNVGTPGHRASREFNTAQAAKEFLMKRHQKKVD